MPSKKESGLEFMQSMTPTVQSRQTSTASEMRKRETLSPIDEPWKGSRKGSACATLRNPSPAVRQSKSSFLTHRKDSHRVVRAESSKGVLGNVSNAGSPYQLLKQKDGKGGLFETPKLLKQPTGGI